jgi:integrase
VRHAKLSGVTPHTLRHMFAGRLVMRGVDLRTVQELGGWISLNMIQRYAHLSQQHMRQAIEILTENAPTDFTTPAMDARNTESSNIKCISKVGR